MIPVALGPIHEVIREAQASGKATERNVFRLQKAYAGSDFEKAGIHRLIKYLDFVEVPHDKTSPLEIQQQDFVSYYRQFDRRRNKDFFATFPAELTDWMKTVHV
jgi:hypothetical protein